MNTKTVEVTVYVLVDSDGEWAAAGDSNENPQDDIEILKFVRKWNIAEPLGFCRAHRVKVRLPVPELVEMSKNHPEVLDHLWESGELGRDEAHVRVSTEDIESQIDCRPNDWAARKVRELDYGLDNMRDFLKTQEKK